MTRTHYEVLKVSPDASPPEIRTAYRAACLRTHPDKAKPEDKKKAEYEFRRVQQAYEVLSDEEKRRAYDLQRTNPRSNRTSQHQNQHQHQHQNQTQNTADRAAPPYPFFQDSSRASSSSSRGPPQPQDPFGFGFGVGRSPFGGGWPFGGRDPFEDMMSSQRRMADDLSRMAAAARFQSATYPFPAPPPPPFAASSSSAALPPTTMQSTRQSSRSNQAAMYSFMGNFNFNSDGGRWASESHSESWINGQRQTTHKRRDQNGVEHVTHTYPDGTTRYLVNGVEQRVPPSRAIDAMDIDDDGAGPSNRPSRNRRH